VLGVGHHQVPEACRVRCRPQQRIVDGIDGAVAAAVARIVEQRPTEVIVVINGLRNVVLENNVVFGSVNANLRHWLAAANALARADPEWLGGLITRRVALVDYAEALKPGPDDVKVVLDLKL